MSLLEADDRVFIYLRLMADGLEVARTKVRELAGLPGALADLTAAYLRGDIEVPPGLLPRFEYVDNETGAVLIAMWADVETCEQVYEGNIPPRARKRMLHEPPPIDVERFEERAGQELTFAQREQLGDMLTGPLPDILGLIRANIREDGSFHFRLPLWSQDSWQLPDPETDEPD